MMAQTWNNRNTKWNNNRRAPFKQKDKRAPVKITGLRVWVNDGNVEKAIRKLKKKIDNDGKLQELKAREHYEKPSIKRKRARDVARKRHLKEQAERIPSKNRLY